MAYPQYRRLLGCNEALGKLRHLPLTIIGFEETQIGSIFFIVAIPSANRLASSMFLGLLRCTISDPTALYRGLSSCRKFLACSGNKASITLKPCKSSTSQRSIRPTASFLNNPVSILSSTFTRAVLKIFVEVAPGVVPTK